MLAADSVSILGCRFPIFPCRTSAGPLRYWRSRRLHPGPDTLAALLDSKDEDARKEAQDALLAFLGQPVAAAAGAPPEQRTEAVRQWRAWWKAERDKALKIPPMTVLHGRIVTIDAAAGLLVTTLAGKYGVKRGMQLNVRRGDRFVCLLRVAMADAKGSVVKIVPLSEGTPPAIGDALFWAEPKQGDASAPKK